MNGFNIVLGVLFAFDAAMFLTGKGKVVDRYKKKYTEASVKKYSKVIGMVMLLTAIVMIVVGAGSIGLVDLGINFEESIIPTIVYLIVIVIAILAMIVGKCTILKPLDNANAKAKAEEEEEDF